MTFTIPTSRLLRFPIIGLAFGTHLKESLLPGIPVTPTSRQSEHFLYKHADSVVRVKFILANAGTFIRHKLPHDHRTYLQWGNNHWHADKNVGCLLYPQTSFALATRPEGALTLGQQLNLIVQHR